VKDLIVWSKKMEHNRKGFSLSSSIVNNNLAFSAQNISTYDAAFENPFAAEIVSYAVL
jgi:hypothetical protein